MDQFDGSAGSQAAALERAHRLEAAEYADCAVVHAGVRDGVGVRAGGDGGQIGFGARPADESVADGVLADAKPSAWASFLSHARARRSSGEKTTRVTAVPTAEARSEVKVARVLSSSSRRVGRSECSNCRCVLRVCILASCAVETPEPGTRAD